MISLLDAHVGDAKYILCIVAANNDLANQEALTIASAADPDGSRTLTVITKADLAQPGLMNQINSRPCKLGHVAVRILLCVIQRMLTHSMQCFT